MSTGPASRDALREIDDRFVRVSVRTAIHVRRYLPFYVFGLIWVLALALFPTVQGRSEDDVFAGVDGPSTLDAGTGNTEDSAGTATGDPGTSPADSGSTTAGPGPAAATAAQSLDLGQKASGKTKGGLDCKPGVRQIPVSRYAAQCTEAFTGNNGGATSYGVTGDKIVIVRRGFAESASSRAVDEAVKAAGGADPEVTRRVRDEVFLPYFTKMFETYGRKIEWVDYESKYGNSTDEALSKGREGACADATYIKNELKAFMVVNGNNATAVSGVFAECAAERKLLTFDAGSYYPESWYRSLHPYVWNGVMECERIAHQLSEYMGKRLINKPAKWAKDPVLQRSTRRFGTYVPDVDGYVQCTKMTQDLLAKNYGNKDRGEEYHYALDISRFPDQAAQAIVQFKARGVTTVVLACDPISVSFLTASATQQQYYPEWFQIGTALNDVDNAVRLWEQEQIRGSLFGLSQLGTTSKFLGPNGEPGQLYKMLTGKEIPAGTTGEYYNLNRYFNAIQAAGPILTPDTIAAGMKRLIPGGAPDYPVGYASYADAPDGTAGGGDHTAIDDSREIYWRTDRVSEADGKQGTYVETYNGKRFKNGEWPKEDPPLWPDGNAGR